jgi:hypothetical protein
MRVVAYFESAEDFERAGVAAEHAGWRIVGACAPAFNERVLDAAHATRSPVAAAALAGGFVGLLSGLLLTVGTVREWPTLIVSGKPLISVPPFLIIMFELSILVASVAALWSFLSASARARRTERDACDETTSDNRLSMLLEADAHQAGALDDLLRRTAPSAWRTVS